MMRVVVFHSQMMMSLGGARLFTGAVEEAAELADEALRNARERGEAVLEAWALHLAAEVTAHRSRWMPRGPRLCTGRRSREPPGSASGAHRALSPWARRAVSPHRERRTRA